MATTTSWNLDALDPRLTAITMDAASRPSVYDEIVVQKDGNNRQQFPMPHKMTDTEVGPLGPMARTYENDPFYEDTPGIGYKKTTAWRKFTTKLVFTEEVKDDDLWGLVDQYASRVGEAERLTKDIQVAQIMDNAFNTTYHTGRDTLAICSASHTSRMSAATRSNILATSAAFGYGSMQFLLTGARRQKDMRGYPDPALVDGEIAVILQPEDEWMYTTLFDDRSQYEPGTDSNSPNVLKGGKRRFKMILNVFQTGTGTSATRLWFLMDKSKEPIWLVNRKKLTTDTYMLPGNKSVAYDARCRYWYHIKNVFGIYGSGE